MLLFTKTEYLIAKRYLFTKRKESFISFISIISLLGITLGVAALISIMSVMNGFKDEIIKNIIGINGHITITGNNHYYLNNYNQVLDFIVKNNKLKAINPSIEGQALIDFNSKSTGALVRGIFKKDLISRYIFKKSLLFSNLDEFDKYNNVVILGSELAFKLGIKLGDSIFVLSPSKVSTPFGDVPITLTLKVIAIFNTGMYEYDSNLILIPHNTAEYLFNLKKSTQKLEIFLHDLSLTDEIKHKLLSDLYQKFHTGFKITTWQESNSYFLDALATEKNVMFLILSLIILIASFNIVSGLLMLVKTKTKEIAILRAMGFSVKNIRNIFFIIGSIISLSGVFLGTVLGLLISYNTEALRNLIYTVFNIDIFSESVYSLSKLPATVNYYQVLFIIIFAILMSFISTLYPAKKASKIEPKEGLDYE